MVQSSFIAAQGDDVVVSEGNALAMVGNSVNMNSSQAGVVVANEVNSENSSSVILLTRTVNGSVQTTLDTRQAALAGLVAGVAVGMVLFVGNLLSSRRR
jgi:hypothetical protein